MSLSNGALNGTFADSAHVHAMPAKSAATPLVAKTLPLTDEMLLRFQERAPGYDQQNQFFAEDFGTPAYYDAARAALQRFESADPIEAYADILDNASLLGAYGRNLGGVGRGIPRALATA